MIDLVIGPIVCPVKARANKKLGGRKRHWSGEGSLAAEQRARVRAAFRRCSVCNTPARAFKLPCCSWAEAAIRHDCNHLWTPLTPQPLPPRGQEHPLDVLLVRIPSHGGRPLDEHDGLPMALKAVVDQIAEELWPRDASGKLIGRVDDSVSWLRWLYGERLHRKPRKRPRPGDPPPDPSNVGTELLEIVIAPRCVCRYCGDVPPLKQRWLGGGP